MNVSPIQQSGVHYKSDVQRFLEDPSAYWNGLTDNERLVLFTFFRMALTCAFPALVGPASKELLETRFVEYKTPEHLTWMYTEAMTWAWYFLVSCCVVFAYILYLARRNKLRAVKEKETPKGLNTPLQWCVSLAMVLLSLAHATKEFGDHVGELLKL